MGCGGTFEDACERARLVHAIRMKHCISLQRPHIYFHNGMWRSAYMNPATLRKLLAGEKARSNYEYSRNQI